MLYRVTIEGETVEVELKAGRLSSVDGSNELLGVPLDEWSVESIPDGFLLIGSGQVLELCITPQGAHVAHGQARASVRVLAPHDAESAGTGGSTSSEQELRAPMPGKVVKVAVVEGDKLTEGDLLLVIEAMKMQNELHAGTTVAVAEICVKEGQSVEGDELLIRFEPVAD